jgi:hypothetical protein
MAYNHTQRKQEYTMNVASIAKRGLFLASLLGISAAAAFAQSTASLPYEEDFSTWTADAAVYGQAPAAWTVNAEDGSTITALEGDAGNVLALNTDGQTLQVNFDDNGTVDNDMEANDLYVDAMVKFVISEDDPAAIPADVKTAVWLNANSNLVVYHGMVVDQTTVATTTTFNVVLDPEQFYQLRIKTAWDDIAYAPYFKYYIDGVALADSENTEWFLSAYGNQFLQGLAFQGTGMVDDIAVGDASSLVAQWTLTVPDIANASFQENGVALAAGSYQYDVTTPVTVSLAAAAGYTATGMTNGVAATFPVTFQSIPEGGTVVLSATVTKCQAMWTDGTTTNYMSLAEALAKVATDGGTIALNNDVAVDGMIIIEDDVTLDLAGYEITASENYSAISTDDAIFAVKHGGTFTINDSSDPSTGAITSNQDGTKPYAAVKLTYTGDTVDTLPATLEVNNGTLTGYYYAIVGNGSAGRGNTVVTINGGNILGTCVNDSAAIYHPQAGTLTINGGYLEGAVGVYVKAGIVETTVNAGEIVGNGAATAYNPSKNGFTATGDAFVVDNAGYPGGSPQPSIEGGTFTSTYGDAIASYAMINLDPVINFVSGGTFSSEVPADLCAIGYETVDNGDNTYGVEIAVYTLTYVTAQGVAPAAVEYTVESNDFALAAAPVAAGYDFLGWVIGATTNAAGAMFDVSANLADTTATAAWAESANPYPNSPSAGGVTIVSQLDDATADPLEFTSIDTSTGKITFTATIDGSGTVNNGLYLVIKNTLDGEASTLAGVFVLDGTADTGTVTFTLPAGAEQVLAVGITDTEIGD